MHEVQSILRRRAKGGGRDVEYLIRWRGYGSDHDTWEPKANLVEHCDDMIRAFEVERAAEKAAAAPPAARKRSRMDGGGLAELPAWRGSFEAATAGMAVAEVAGVAAAAVAAAANAASAAAGGGAEMAAASRGARRRRARRRWRPPARRRSSSCSFGGRSPPRSEGGGALSE